MTSDWSVRTIMLEARSGVKRNPGGPWEAGGIQSRTEVMGMESYTVNKTEGNFGSGKCQRRCLEGDLKMAGRACQPEDAAEARA